MHNQPRYRPLSSSKFFADGKSAREPVPGTVARGELREDRAYFTGMVDDSTFTTELPFVLTRDVLERGRERYGIYCSVCHDAVGTGRGMVVRRGYKQPPSFHIDRLRDERAGYFFDVITQGFAKMPGYAAQIPVQDRWAIVAYLRALQFSQRVPVAEMPAALRAEFERASAAPPPPPSGGAPHG